MELGSSRERRAGARFDCTITDRRETKPLSLSALHLCHLGVNTGLAQTGLGANLAHKWLLNDRTGDMREKPCRRDSGTVAEASMSSRLVSYGLATIRKTSKCQTGKRKAC